MENYQISRPCGRPYNATCGMAREMTGNQTGFYRCAQRSPASSPSSSCTTVSGNSEMYSPIEHLPIAMAYVPRQKFSTTYDLNYALRVGTVFPELCKPFCGKRGVRR